MAIVHESLGRTGSVGDSDARGMERVSGVGAGGAAVSGGAVLGALFVRPRFFGALPGATVFPSRSAETSTVQRRRRPARSEGILIARFDIASRP
jgi:hypothetical protein